MCVLTFEEAKVAIRVPHMHDARCSYSSCCCCALFYIQAGRPAAVTTVAMETCGVSDEKPLDRREAERSKSGTRNGEKSRGHKRLKEREEKR